MRNNIYKKEIRKKCILCGNCSAVCPQNAISYDNVNERVTIDKKLCINCGICIKNCPATDDKRINNTLFGDIYRIYAGYSNDETIRFKAASGGILTQTLKYLIENKFVDKVLITDFKSDFLQSESYFTNNIDEVINACGSKYQIVNVNKTLKTVLKDDLKYAFVGLPCHHIGLEKFIKTNPKIKNRIVYKFAICCSHNCNINILDYVTHYLKIKREDIKSIKYRGDGWPEYLTVTTKNNEKLKFPQNIWNNLFLAFFYTPKQCFNCTDFCGENADISFADAWLEEYTSKDSSGYNLVFSHNKNGEDLLQKMYKEHTINLIEHSERELVNAQIIGLIYKKYIYKSKQPINLILKILIRFNSFISTQSFFKFVKPTFLRYYFYVLNLIFIRTQLKKFKKVNK